MTNITNSDQNHIAVVFTSCLSSLFVTLQTCSSQIYEHNELWHINHGMYFRFSLFNGPAPNTCPSLCMEHLLLTATLNRLN